MKVVSVSLTDKNLEDIETIKNDRGLANNSEAVRCALLDCIEKIGSEKSFAGKQGTVLIVSHSHETEKFVSQTKHRFQSLVRTQNHFCTTGERCIDLFLLSGPGEKIKKMRDTFFRNKKIEKIALVPV
ncbi:MAG: hypothetical protein Q7K34_04120 [archaeon]|nr:hypothetical protein [archaeon]